MIRPLAPPHSFQVQAASGWLELGNVSEAWNELQALPKSLRSHPHALDLYWQVYAAWNKWDRAHEVADRLVRDFPDESCGWVHRSYALRRLRGGGVRPALDALHPAADRFPDEPVIPYNLACYCAQLGELTEARKWLKRAMKAGDERVIHRMALADPDLQPLKTAGYLK